MRLGHITEAELVEYVDGEIDVARAAVLERHLSRCHPCGVSLKRLRQATAAG